MSKNFGTNFQICKYSNIGTPFFILRCHSKWEIVREGGIKAQNFKKIREKLYGTAYNVMYLRLFSRI